MSWISDVISGADIESVWGNAIRDRTVTPFLDKAERTAQLPSPSVGMLTWIEDEKVAEFYDGTEWTTPATAVPVGGIIPYCAPNAPPGSTWQVPNGAAISRTTFAELFALCGVTYGAGNGTTTFNLPDLRNRFIYGRNAEALNTKAGATTHTLTDAEMPSHTHGITGSAQFITGSHPASTIYTNAGANIDHSPAWNLSATDPTASAGSDSPHNNMPPYIILQYLIRCL